MIQDFVGHELKTGDLVVTLFDDDVHDHIQRFVLGVVSTIDTNQWFNVIFFDKDEDDKEFERTFHTPQIETTFKIQPSRIGAELIEKLEALSRRVR